MFQTFNNIESSFKKMRIFLIVLVIACLAFATYIAYASFSFMERQRSQIYVLAEGQTLLLAKTKNIRENRPIEGKDHVKRFHQLFFSLDPDEQVINERMKEAMYYGDNSVQTQYNNLKEGAYFTNIVGANISQELIVDSISINPERVPYYVKFSGKLKIVRSSTITYRTLVTECYLRDVARTDNNPHGFLMERWNILSNQDIEIIDRSTGDKLNSFSAQPTSSANPEVK